MKPVVSVILNSYLLSLWVTLLVIFLFPVNIEKYRAIPVDKGEYIQDQVVRYDDLDFDGESEKIAVFHNSLGGAGLTVSNTHGVLDQYNFYGRYDFVQRAGTIITGDRDGNGIKEIYVFTLAYDSVFLHCVQDFTMPAVHPEKKFIARCGMRNGKTDAYIVAAEMDDLTGNADKELIFGIATGYSLYPRKIFAWDALRDTFIISPESEYFINKIIQADVTGDGLNEIIPGGYAASNSRDSLGPYPDWNSWLMVLDRDLRFVFEPMKFPGAFSSLEPIVFRDKDGKPSLAVLYGPPDSQGDSAILMSVDLSGMVLKKRTLPENVIFAFTLTDKNDNDWIILCRDKEGFDMLYPSFGIKKSVSATTTTGVILFDADKDGTNEVITTDLVRRHVVIYRNSLKHPVTITIGGSGEQGMLYSLLQQKDKPALLYLQQGSAFNLYQYGQNPRYPLRFLIYAAIYLSILIFALLVRKIQKIQLRKKYEIERKITELQLQIVRNQLDPHFIMNAVNSIIASITEQDKERARQQLLHFSRLHRSLLLSADHMQRSLHEEVAFTRDYLAMEKFRFGDRFDYRIDIDPAIDPETLLPKMILQIHVENAIRHGIMPLKEGGMLTVRAFHENRNIVLEVADNGVGRSNSRNSGSNSTGMGMAVMEQFSELFNKLHVGKIITSIRDLYDGNGNAAGTQVTITITGIYEEQ